MGSILIGWLDGGTGVFFLVIGLDFGFFCAGCSCTHIYTPGHVKLSRLVQILHKVPH